MATTNSNNNQNGEDKYALSQLQPWNIAQSEYFFDTVSIPNLLNIEPNQLNSVFFRTQDSEEEFDEQDEMEMCKNTTCSVETFRVNACFKAETTWAVKYKVKTFGELSKERKEECYRYMQEKHARLEGLINMPRYQAGRERRRIRLRDAYLKQRHRKRVFEKMKSLASVPDPDPNETAQDIHMYNSVEYMDETFGSVQSSQTVIRRPPKSTTKSTRSSTAIQNQSVEQVIEVIEESVIVESIVVSQSSQSHSNSRLGTEKRFNHISPSDISIDEAEPSEPESVASYYEETDNEIIVYADTSDDESYPSVEFSKIFFKGVNTPGTSTQSSRSKQQSQSQSELQTYSQFERDGVVTSTQDFLI